MATDFGKRVAAARKRAGYTQKELAPLVGMSQSNLSELETVAFESGKTAQIAWACGVNAHWLATGEGPMLSGLLADRPPADTATTEPTAPKALPAALDALRHARPEVREELAQVLALLVRSGSARYAERAMELLDMPDAPSGKRAA